MEHLPMPKGAKLSEDDIVPYIATTDYLGTPFLTYPSVKGFHHALPKPDVLGFIKYEQGQPTPDDKLAPFLQTWLFFGLLQESFGCLYRHEDFVCSYASSKGPIEVLTTAKLPDLLRKRFPATSEIDNNLTSLVSHLHGCIKAADEAVDIVATRLSREISFSILAMMETLCATLNLYAIKGLRFRLNLLSSFPSTYWTERMSLNGWCPREGKIAFESLKSAYALHYVAKMKKSYKGDSHCNCTQNECNGMQKDLTKYKPRHCDPDCNCPIISIDNKRLNLILERGKVPLVRIQVQEKTGDLSVELVELTSQYCYVALSHVWADGLGNPFENALPKCQLLGLQNLAKDVIEASGTCGTALLWLDTLCVPCQPGTGKMIAMAMMRGIYEEADHVLVLESSLRCCRAGSMDLVEAGFRIFTSPWLRRLWCLQEGAFAKKLWFQFEDRPVDLAEILKDYRAIHYSRDISQMELTFRIMRIYNTLRFLVDETGKSKQVSSINVHVVVQALRYRALSVASDEPICLANLFEIDTNVLSEPDGSPMSHFWGALCRSQRVPRSIIFFQSSKLEDKGFRWAPSTLLGAENPIYLIDQPPKPVALSQKGLIVRFPGLLMSRHVPDIIPLIFHGEGLLPLLWYLLDERTKRWYGLMSQSADVHAYFCGKDPEDRAKMLVKEKVFAVIFSHDPHIEEETPIKHIRALLVSIEVHEDGMFYTRRQSSLTLTKYSPDECLIYSRALDIARSLDRDELIKAIFQAKIRDASQQSKALNTIVEAIIAKAKNAAALALEDPALRGIHDSIFYPPHPKHFLLVIWKLYTHRLTMVKEWLPDDTVWCLD